MKVIAAIVGIDHWIDLTFPFAMSIHTRNPNLDVLVIDNVSEPTYPEVPLWRTRRTSRRVGYNLALNFAMEEDADWYIVFNNDCECHNGFEGVFEHLDPHTLYGSGTQWSQSFQTWIQWSAWLAISRELKDTIGLFDPELDAGFEDFDYQKRAMDAGFKLDHLRIDVQHLDKHTRLVEPDYAARWEKCRLYFSKKWNVKTERWL